jgi:hypothetical protein
VKIFPQLAVFFCLGCEALLPGASRHKEAATAGELVLTKGFAFVDVYVNDAGPFRMMIDTGADSCALTPNAAQAAGLHYDSRVRMSTISGETIVPVSSKNAARVGETEREEVEFAVQTLEGIRNVSSNVDGVLGQSFLRQAPYLIDYKGKRLWLGDEATQRAESLSISATTRHELPGTVIPVTIGTEKKSRMLRIDSGTSELILECVTSCPHAMSLETVHAVTNHGEREVKRGVLQDIRIGGQVAPGGGAILIENVEPEPGREGLLPARWFAAVYVDSTRDIVRLGR